MQGEECRCVSLIFWKVTDSCKTGNVWVLPQKQVRWTFSLWELDASSSPHHIGGSAFLTIQFILEKSSGLEFYTTVPLNKWPYIAYIDILLIKNNSFNEFYFKIPAPEMLAPLVYFPKIYKVTSPFNSWVSSGLLAPLHYLVQFTPRDISIICTVLVQYLSEILSRIPLVHCYY